MHSFCPSSSSNVFIIIIIAVETIVRKSPARIHVLTFWQAKSCSLFVAEITVSGSPSAKHSYDNVQISTSPQSKAPPSTGTAQNRAPQPLPASQPSPRPGIAPATPHQSAGHQVHMTSPGHKGQTMIPHHLPGHKGQVSSHQPGGQAIPGMVSAMGGKQHPVPLMRRGSAKSAGSHHTQPVTVMPGYPRGGAGGPMVVQARQPHSAGTQTISHQLLLACLRFYVFWQRPGT